MISLEWCWRSCCNTHKIPGPKDLDSTCGGWAISHRPSITLSPVHLPNKQEAESGKSEGQVLVAKVAGKDLQAARSFP
jgi:hypothetical protein